MRGLRGDLIPFPRQKRRRGPAREGRLLPFGRREGPERTPEVDRRTEIALEARAQFDRANELMTLAMKQKGRTACKARAAALLAASGARYVASVAGDRRTAEQSHELALHAMAQLEMYCFPKE